MLNSNYMVMLFSKVELKTSMIIVSIFAIVNYRGIGMHTTYEKRLKKIVPWL